ncbi:DUF6531 domain-containing protein [Massilia sp. B-10]|nr:DUF6531 domain-containing protein [Massilia sp. B-10]
MKYFVLSVILLMFNGLARADAVADECGMTSCTGHLIRDGHTGVFRMDGGSPTNGGGKSRSKKIDKKDEPPLKLDPIVATAVDPCQRTKNPVVVGTGEKFKEEQDFYTAGPYGLDLKRTYRSGQPAGGIFGA